MDKRFWDLAEALKKFNKDNPQHGTMAYIILYDDGSGHIGEFTKEGWDHGIIDLFEFSKKYLE